MITTGSVGAVMGAAYEDACVVHPGFRTYTWTCTACAIQPEQCTCGSLGNVKFGFNWG